MPALITDLFKSNKIRFGGFKYFLAIETEQRI